MVKHIQTIRRKFADELIVFCHFVGWRLNFNRNYFDQTFSACFSKERNGSFFRNRKETNIPKIMTNLNIVLSIFIKEITKKRSSHQRCSARKGVLRNFTKFAGKHLCRSLFFDKVAGLRPATLLKKALAQVFSC